MKSLLKKILFGIHHPKEYLCTSAGEIEATLNVYAHVNGEKIPAKQNLLFLGYSPLVMGWITDSFNAKQLLISFERKDNSKVIATLTLQLEKEVPLGNQSLFIFRGIASTQHFENGFHQFMFRIFDRFRSKGSANIDLDPQLYNQVKIAYSIPREIKLITLGTTNAYNVFPTDLHGRAGENAYIISLRHDKKACAQVMQQKKLALWTMEAQYAKEVYALGKNHSRDLAPPEKHAFTANTSPEFNLPEPVGAIACEELQLEKQLMDIGIHRLLLFKTKGAVAENDTRRLTHLHRSYVQWHERNGFAFTESKR